MREQERFDPYDASDLAVLRHLHGSSAHSDIVEPLWLAIRSLPDASLYSPDPTNFAYALAHVRGKAFAFAEGMHSVAVRLPPESAAAARAEGAKPIAGLDSWLLLPLFDSPALLSRCAHWVARAHAFACARRSSST